MSSATALLAYWWHTGAWDDEPPRRAPSYETAGKSLQVVAAVPLEDEPQTEVRLAGCTWALNEVFTGDEQYVAVYRRLTAQKRCTSFS